MFAADVKEDNSSLSKLPHAPVKIFVKDVKETLDKCGAALSARAAKRTLGNLFNSSKSVEQLQTYFNSLQPKEDEKASLLKTKEHDAEQPLTDKQLFELAKTIIQFNLNEKDDQLRECLDLLKEKFKHVRLLAIYRCINYQPMRLENNFNFATFKLLFEFSLAKVDAAAIYIVLNAEREIPILDQQKEDAKKVAIWFNKHVALMNDPTAWIEFFSWRLLNMKIFVEFAMACPFSATDKLSDALIILIQNKICTAENREFLLKHPTYALDIASGLEWLQKRKIYTPENVKKIFDNVEIAQYLNKTGEPAADQDTVLNQQIFDATIARAPVAKAERKQTVSLLFVKPAKAQYKLKDDTKQSSGDLISSDDLISFGIADLFAKKSSEDVEKVSELISGYSPF